MMKKLKNAEIEALGAANKGPVVPQIANIAAGLDEKKPSGKPWWQHVLDVVVAGAKSFVGGLLGGTGKAGEAAAAAMRAIETVNRRSTFR